jgi:hypothetical protein
LDEHSLARLRRPALCAALVIVCGLKAQADPPITNLPSDIPAEFKPKTDGFDYDKREVMIPMRPA